LQSYQNLKLLQNFYRLKAIGYEYIDPIELNSQTMDIKINDIASLDKQIQTCHLCDFSKSRKQSLSGFGNTNADLMIIDYVVSELQDSYGDFFQGRSALMLRDMITNVLNLDINEVFITHLIKCKPLSNLTNYETQWLSCKSYLTSQIEFIKPKLIVTLGKEVYKFLLPNGGSFDEVRGHIIEYQNSKLIPIYHPNYVLRNPNLKKIVYNDLKTIKSCL